VISNLDHIRSYYGALNTGDVELIASHFTDDATHYYTRLGPHHGRGIAENARWAIDNLEGQWWYEHANPAGDLLGFDFAGRGYTTMEAWRAPVG
jgi:SnoaL-like domain